MTSQEPHAIVAHDSKESVMNAFSSYNTGWTSGVEQSASCTIGMMNMCPVAIKAPENVQDIEKYIIERRVFHVTGGAIGRGYYGIPVKEEILELKEFDIWKESMKIAGIAH